MQLILKIPFETRLHKQKQSFYQKKKNKSTKIMAMALNNRDSQTSQRTKKDTKTRS